MSHTFKRGNVEDFICSFLTLENKEPTTIVNPKVTIRHVDATYVVIDDIIEATMVLMYENTYYFRWNVAADAYIGTYNVECSGIVDGEYAERNETILVIA
jgi:hypothetical protein